DTTYPFEETVRIGLKLSGPSRFPLVLRVPGWCEQPSVSVAGKALKLSGTGPWVRLGRTWRDGDQVVLKLPSKPEVKVWSENHNAETVYLGPLAFSLKIGEKYTISGGSKDFPSYEVAAQTPWNYALASATPLEVTRRKLADDAQPFSEDTAPISIYVQ